MGARLLAILSYLALILMLSALLYYPFTESKAYIWEGYPNLAWMLLWGIMHYSQRGSRQDSHKHILVILLLGCEGQASLAQMPILDFVFNII